MVGFDLNYVYKGIAAYLTDHGICCGLPEKTNQIYRVQTFINGRRRYIIEINGADLLVFFYGYDNTAAPWADRVHQYFTLTDPNVFDKIHNLIVGSKRHEHQDL